MTIRLPVILSARGRDHAPVILSARGRDHAPVILSARGRDGCAKDLVPHDPATCLLGGVKSKGPTPIVSPPMDRSAIWAVGFTCMPL